MRGDAFLQKYHTAIYRMVPREHIYECLRYLKTHFKFRHRNLVLHVLNIKGFKFDSTNSELWPLSIYCFQFSLKSLSLWLHSKVIVFGTLTSQYRQLRIDHFIMWAGNIACH